MTDLAKLVVRLEAQTAQYMAQLDKANKRLERFDKQAEVSAARIAKGVAAAAVGAGIAFAGMAFQAVKAADDMGKLAQSSGIAVESLSQLDYAASLSGSSLDELTIGMNKLTKQAVEAAKGSTTASKAFAAIGVSVKNADGSMRSTEDIMLDIAERFSQIEDGAGKAAIAQELFGKSGTKLIPFLNQGRAGIEALKKEADALGLTITNKTAKAAEEFNDDLDRIKFAAKGLANQAANELLPVFGAMAERFANAAKEGGAMDFAVKALSVTLKTLVSAGTIVTSIFQQLGRVIYGVGAAVVRVAQGEFGLAVDEIKDAFADARSNVTEDMENIAKVWSDTVPAFEETAKNIDSAMKESLVFNDERAEEEAKKAADAALKTLEDFEASLQEQVATFGMANDAVVKYRLANGDLADALDKAGPKAAIFKDTIGALAEQLEEMRKKQEETEQKQRDWDAAVEEGRKITEAVRTPLEVYGDTLERLNQLLLDGHIAHQTYERAVTEAQETLEKATKKQNKFLEEANRNVQDILAGGLETALKDGVSKGAKGALDAFYDMLTKMATQAIAANLAQKIFGSEGMGGGGGWIDTAMSWFGKLFGGTMDSGGRGKPGVAYAIGTGAQPEVFVPDQPGTFYPRGEGMGGNKLTQNIYVQGQVNQRSARQLELEALRRQRVANARLG